MEDIKIKSSWPEVTIGEYQQIIAIAQTETEETDAATLLDNRLKILSILSGKEVDYFESMPQCKTREYLMLLSFLKTPIPSGEIKRSYKMGGKVFDVTGTAVKLSKASVKSLKAIQFIDYMNYKKNNANTPRIDTIHKELAIYVIPKKEDYGVPGKIGVSENAEIIRDQMPIVDALAISDFFFAQFEALLMTSASSLERKMMKALRKKGGLEAESLLQQIKQLQDLKSKNRFLRFGGGASI